MTDIDTLKRKRAVAKGKITRIYNIAAGYSDNPDTLDGKTANCIKTSLGRLEVAWQHFADIQDEILILDDVDEDEENQEYADQEKRFDETKTLLSDIMDKLTMEGKTVSPVLPTLIAPTSTSSNGHLN